MIDTGIWRNIGQRLWAVREQVAGEEMFFANYSDGLCDVNLNEMTAVFRASGKIGCFLAVRPSFSLHLVEMRPSGKVERLRASQDADLWINGGFFIFRKRSSTTCGKAMNWSRPHSALDRSRPAHGIQA